MDNSFNSRFMQSVQKGGQKLGTGHFVGALQGAMVSLMGTIIIGAIFQILQSVLGPTMLKLIPIANPWYSWPNLPHEFTVNFLAVWVVLLLIYQYARNLQLRSPIITTLDALVIFFLTAAPVVASKTSIVSLNTTYPSAQGTFIGFVISDLVVRIEEWRFDKNIRTKMPDVVPQFLQDGFAAILPLLFEVITFGRIHIGIISATGGEFDLASGFMAVLSTPLGALVSTPSTFVLLSLACLLWIFGIHSSVILMSLVTPTSLETVAVNAKLHVAGQALKFGPVFLAAGLAVAGSTGDTIPLVLMGLRAKPDQIRATAKVSLIPGWLNTNEPVMFGMPIMYNPVLTIPYILNVLIVTLLYLIGLKTGIPASPFIPITTVLPVGFGSYLGSLNSFSFVWDYLIVIVVGVIWFLFFKACDNQLYEKEQETAKSESGNSTTTVA